VRTIENDGKRDLSLNRKIEKENDEEKVRSLINASV